VALRLHSDAPMMKTMLLSAFAVFTFSVAGCGGGDDSPMTAGGNHNGTTETATCRASIMPSTIDYVVTGDTLEFVQASTQTHSPPMKRLKASTATSKPVFGTWQMPIDVNAGAQAVGLTVSATLDIEPASVTVTTSCGQHGRSATAKVTSPATVTDTTITTADFQVEEKKF
jgi:hypothetical protein